MRCASSAVQCQTQNKIARIRQKFACAQKKFRCGGCIRESLPISMHARWTGEAHAISSSEVDLVHAAALEI
jgi:hypothetical protein